MWRIGDMEPSSQLISTQLHGVRLGRIEEKKDKWRFGDMEPSSPLKSARLRGVSWRGGGREGHMENLGHGTIITTQSKYIYQISKYNSTFEKFQKNVSTFKIDYNIIMWLFQLSRIFQLSNIVQLSMIFQLSRIFQLFFRINKLYNYEWSSISIIYSCIEECFSTPPFHYLMKAGGKDNFWGKH